ncbi:NB-ARC domain-containing protein [Saccharothrix sp. BKS2]|uniref:NB-ARC domain-containing protein n=1 Tax=Saccharothrix sp. BKS2 TaxID=3064400 RepID=UPI0039EB6A21
MANDVSGPVVGNVVQAGVINEVTIVSVPAPAGAPRQLPVLTHGLVDRSEDVARLDRAVARGCEQGRPSIAVLTGMGGVGKTACALNWAHRNADRFDGGQLYADLNAYRGKGGVAISDVLAAFLRSLGVHSQYMPADFAERVALFRSMTARAKVLVLLDDADAPAQVRAAVPASAGSLVLATSRFRLGGLVLDGAEVVELRPLAPAQGAALVASMVGDDRVEQDPDGLRDLVRLCAGLPLALRVAGAELVRRRRWSLSRLVRHLADDRARLDRLSLEGDNLVERIFDATYENLPEAGRSLYRALGLHPGPEFGVDLAAAATTDAEVEDLLDVLRAVNLVEEWAPDRYRLHDLIHLHARGLAQREDASETRVATERRIVRWYLLGAAAADHAVLGAARWRIARHDLSAWDTPFDAGSGMAWFDTERANLVAAVRLAHALGMYAEVWQFCEALWAFYHSRKYYADWIETHQLGAESALRLDDRLAESRMRNQLARAYVETQEFERAQAELDRATSVASDHERSRALLDESLGLLRREQERYEEAAEAFRAAQEGNRRLEDRRGDGLQGYQFGDALVRAGRPTDALPVLEQALTLLDEARDEMGVARVHIALGRAYGALDRVTDARRVLDRAVATTRERSQPIKEAQALEVLVEVAGHQHDRVLFRDSADRLYQIYLETGNPRAREVRRWIDESEPSASQG